MGISTPDVSASLLIALLRAAMDFNTEQEPAWQAKSIRLRRVTGRTAADDSLIHYLEERLSTGIPSVQLVVATAEALLDAGHSSSPWTFLIAEHYRPTAKYGPGATQTSSALGNLAAARAAIARARQGHPDASQLFDVAIERCQQLLTYRAQQHRKGNLRTIGTRHLLANLMANAYKYTEAINEGTICIREMTGILRSVPTTEIG